MTLHDYKDLALLIGSITGTLVTLGIGAYVHNVFRKTKKVAKAIILAPDLLHQHAEKGDAVLTASGIIFLFPQERS